LRADHIDDVINILPNLHQLGTQTIVVTGGEPLLVRKLPRLLKSAKQAGMHIVLSTNGTLVERRHAEILPHLDWIALPLDGPTDDIHNASRPGKIESFHAVLTSIKLCRELYPSVHIKLGTVITRYNADSVFEIPRTVDSAVGPPDVWRIYETSFSSYGEDNRATLELSPTDFSATLEKAFTAARRVGWRTSVYLNAERSGKYLFMEPNGDAMVIDDGREVVIGNFLNDLPAVEDRWCEYVDVDLLEDNVENTYPM